MVFEWKDEGKLHRIPKLEPGPPNVYFGDVFSTSSSDAPNPLTGSFFLLEKVEKPEPAPTYSYDESGIVFKGESAIILVRTKARLFKQSWLFRR
ncbi:hypothetical protein CCM_08474 [Cordyceps militaris CM01]|uniref:Uncharacterized protein n=1 Tax=Cordyceps militaris (strain CM01) TaxID=983644 RepID=G3JRP0_CORMM|nr:uncharacterized protein CCM_08474 [Cordyceps militaris CM01]EGX88430.1 hypothetical protein CCM_08474 [Cordyceps militaris CM01]